MSNLTQRAECLTSGFITKNLLGDHSVADPPDSMPNSEVKRSSADGSVGLPHVRVGHRQALISTSFFMKEVTIRS